MTAAAVARDDTPVTRVPSSQGHGGTCWHANQLSCIENFWFIITTYRCNTCSDYFIIMGIFKPWQHMFLAIYFWLHVPSCWSCGRKMTVYYVVPFLSSTDDEIAGHESMRSCLCGCPFHSFTADDSRS